MNWRLVFLASMFGLAMAFATISMIPSNVEPVVWLIIFLILAYLLGTRAKAYVFLHGLCVGILNSVWITGAHVFFVDTYLANHASEADMMAMSPLAHHPRLMMLLIGPLVGVISGIIIGLLSMLAAKFFSRPSAVQQA